MRLEDGKTQLMILAGYVEADAQGLIYHVNPDEIVNKLASGADVNLQCSAGKTALMYAAIASNAMAVKVLLEHGANPDIVDAEGKTAMFHQLENVLSEPVRSYHGRAHSAVNAADASNAKWHMGSVGDPAFKNEVSWLELSINRRMP